MTYLAKTKLAVEIAGLERHRFNQAAANGLYPCAPATVAGSSRLFDVNDIIALMVYREELELGTNMAEAAKLACVVRGFLHLREDADMVIAITTDAFRCWNWTRPEHFDLASDFHNGEKVDQVRIFKLRLKRMRIIQKLAEAAQILGEDE